MEMQIEHLFFSLFFMVVMLCSQNRVPSCLAALGTCSSFQGTVLYCNSETGRREWGNGGRECIYTQ